VGVARACQLENPIIGHKALTTHTILMDFLWEVLEKGEKNDYTN